MPLVKKTHHFARSVPCTQTVELECQHEQMFCKQSTTNLRCDKKSHNSEHVHTILHSCCYIKQPQEF
jgi:hypothetical protein